MKRINKRLPGQAMSMFLLEIIIAPAMVMGAPTSAHSVLDKIQGGTQIQTEGLANDLTKEQTQALMDRIHLFEEKGQSVSFVMEDLEKEICVYYNADKTYFSASTIKAPYVVQVMENYVDTQKVSLDDTKFYRSEYEYIGGTGKMKDDPIDSSYSLRQVITRTIHDSDNIGYQMLFRKFGGEEFSKWYEDHGITDLSGYTDYPMFTAVDLAKMWEGIYEYLYGSSPNATWLGTRFRDSQGSVIKAALGEQYTVYSKPGFMVSSSDGYNVFHDGGVVEDGKSPYVLSVLSDGAGWDEAANSQDTAQVKENKENLMSLVRVLSIIHEELTMEQDQEPQEQSSEEDQTEHRTEDQAESQAEDRTEHRTEDRTEDQAESQTEAKVTPAPSEKPAQEDEDSAEEIRPDMVHVAPRVPEEEFVGPRMEKVDKRSSQVLRITVDNLSDGKGVQRRNTNYAPEDSRMKELNASIEKIEGKGQNLSFLMLDLNTAAAYYYQPEKVLFSASTIKGPYIASVVENYVDTQEASLQEEMFRRSDYGESQGTGIIKLDPEDTVYTLDEMITKTIRYSDDVGYAMLRNKFGPEVFKEWLKEAGVDPAYGESAYPMLTVKDLAKMWIRMDDYFDSDGLNAQWLKDKYTQSESSTIRMKLEKSKLVYTKPGFNEGYNEEHIYDAFDDAGIVDDGRYPYILVIMTDAKGWDNASQSSEDPEVQENMQNLMELAGQLDALHEEYVEHLLGIR